MLRLLVVHCHACLATLLSMGASLCTFLLWVQPVGAGLLIDGNSLFRIGERENLCAITFDDGPSQHTSQLLDLLRERQIPATFFVLGTQVDRRPQLIERMRDEGHEIANHTTTHVSLRHLAPERQREEIKQVQDMLLALRVTSLYMRPPFGRYDPNTLKVAQELGIKVILWSVDSFDWKRQAAMTNMRSVAGGPTLRGVFLFHDTHKPTIAAMPYLLDELAANGCRFVTVSDFLAAGAAPSPQVAPANPAAQPEPAPMPPAVKSEPSPHWSVSSGKIPEMAAAWISARPDTPKADPEGGIWPFFKNSQPFKSLTSLVEQVFAE